MKIAFVASEIAPFASTGGLAEVGGSLPHALEGLGVEVLRIMPLYRRVLDSLLPVRDTGIRLKVPVGFRTLTADVWHCEKPGPTTYFIRRDEFFDRSHLYNLPDRDYDDNFRALHLLPESGGGAARSSGRAGGCRARQRLADRAGPAVPRTRGPRPGARTAGEDGVHHPQPGLPGDLSRVGVRIHQPAVLLLLDRVAGVLRQGQLPEGGGHLRGCRDHGQPDLCRGDPAGGWGIRPPRIAARGTRQADRHRKRHRP
jgi:hypothetical protein